MVNRLSLLLTSNELRSLDDGLKVKRHFHLLGSKTVLVVAWNRQKDNLHRGNCEELFSPSISVANIPLSLKDIGKLDKGDTITLMYSAFEINVAKAPVKKVK